MYGGFLVPPDDDGADLGVLFWHKDGYSTACGHGTIALGAWAVESGRVAAPADGDVDVTIDVPSGRVVARVRCRAGASSAWRSATCPSFVVARGVQARGVRGRRRLRRRDLRLRARRRASACASCPMTCRRSSRPAARSRARSTGNDVARHPDDERLSGIYGTVLHEELGPRHHRNVAIFADGEVDRSPTRLGDLRAHRAARGRRRAGRRRDLAQRLDRRHDVPRPRDRRRPGGVLTEVEGTASAPASTASSSTRAIRSGPGFVLR